MLGHSLATLENSLEILAHRLAILESSAGTYHQSWMFCSAGTLASLGGSLVSLLQRSLGSCSAGTWVSLGCTAVSLLQRTGAGIVLLHSEAHR
jgi:hypothetical protein